MNAIAIGLELLPALAQPKLVMMLCLVGALQLVAHRQAPKAPAVTPPPAPARPRR